MMKPVFLLAAMACLTLTALPAAAGCYADYKAKQDGPLRLHYGVAKLPDDACSKDGAKRVLGRRLQQNGWTLLTVLGVFDDSGLAERKSSAGEFYLRY